MRTVSIFELRENLANYLESVSTSDVSLVVRRFGKPIALISPYKSTAVPLFTDYFGFLPKTEKGSEFVNRVRRSNKEKARVEKLRTSL